jgi:hypothetical protein
VSKARPPVGEDVLITLSTNKVVVGMRFHEFWDWSESDDEADNEAHVTHWMPFPDPAQGA